MTAASPPWSELSTTLRRRRNLQCALTPADQIGSKTTPGPWESPLQFKSRIAESRRRHLLFRESSYAENGVKNEEEARAKIVELQAKEEILWHQCRPDLYPAPA